MFVKTIAKKLESNPELKKILTNINWLLIDRIIQTLISFFVGILVIRYLGPERFGILSYAIAFVALFSIIAKLGIDGVAVREFVEKPKKNNEIFGTLIAIRSFSAILAFVLSTLIILLTRQGDVLTILLTILISLTFFFQISDVIDFWFQSKVQSKYVACTRSFVSLIIGAAKIWLIVSLASLIAFAWIILFESALIAVGLTFFYLKNSSSPKKIRVNYSYGKKILSESYPLILSGVAVVIYMKIDQIMIGNMLDSNLLGNYSAAVALSEVWYFIPTIIAGSIFPAIIYAKKINKKLYFKRAQLLYDLFFWGSLIAALPISIFSNFIIKLLYGQQYAQAGPVLAIYIWAGVAVSLGIASNKFLIAENLTKIALYRTVLGAVLNLILNLLFIPKYGIVGSAVATLFSYFVSVYAVILFKDSRSIAKMLIKAISPKRLLLKTSYQEINSKNYVK